MKKAVPVAKKLVKKGVKRAAEEAQNAIANKVRKVEEIAINKGVPPELAHSASALVESGSREKVSGLSDLANKTADNLIARVASKPSNSKRSLLKARGSKSGRKRLKSGKRRGRQASYDIQNLIDTA